MILLKYDLVTAVMHGYSVKPDIVMQELGYEVLKMAQDSDTIFYEVASVIRPLHSFLEASEVSDGRFDPRETARVENIDPEGTGDSNPLPSLQDVSWPRMIGYELSDSKNPTMDPEKKRESLQRTKAKRSSNFRK